MYTASYSWEPAIEAPCTVFLGFRWAASPALLVDSIDLNPVFFPRDFVPVQAMNKVPWTLCRAIFLCLPGDYQGGGLEVEQVGLELLLQGTSPAGSGLTCGTTLLVLNSCFTQFQLVHAVFIWLSVQTERRRERESSYRPFPQVSAAFCFSSLQVSNFT